MILRIHFLNVNLYIKALVFRIAAVFWSYEETLTALFRTSFRVEFPFDMVEIVVFIIIGIIAGLASANFIIFHKYLSKQMPKVFKTKFQRLYIWPALFALIYSTLTFPGLFIKFLIFFVLPNF